MRLLALAVVAAAAWCGEPAIVDARSVFPDGTGHTLRGTIKIIDGFEMPQLHRTRRIWVYLPPDYEKSNRRYPVIYLQDGQNSFDKKTSFLGEWNVDETMETLFAEKKTHGVIAVGIENGGAKRAEEYVPAWMGLVENAQGERYAEFVAETLKPFIDSKFRTKPGRESTAVAGSSAGAIISFHIGTEYPDVFSKIGAFSFTLPASAAARIEDWRKTHRKHRGMRIYLHIGTEENLGEKNPNAMWVENLSKLYAALQSLGYSDAEVKLDVQERGHHNEATWAAKFGGVMLWLFRR